MPPSRFAAVLFPMMGALACSSPYSDESLDELAKAGSWAELARIAADETDDTLGSDAPHIRDGAVRRLAAGPPEDTLPKLIHAMRSRPDLVAAASQTLPPSAMAAHLLPELSARTSAKHDALKKTLATQQSQLVEAEGARLKTACWDASSQEPEEATVLAQQLMGWQLGPDWDTEAKACARTAALSTWLACTTSTCLEDAPSQLSDLPVGDTLDRQVDVLRTVERELAANAQVGARIPSLESDEADLERQLEGALHITIWIHGELAPNAYEVSEAQYNRFAGWLPGRDRYILRTYDTVFTTTGHAKLWIRATGQSEAVTLTGGGSASFMVFEEFQLGEAFTTQLSMVRSELRRERAAEKAARKARPALARRQARALSELHKTLQRVREDTSNPFAQTTEGATSEKPSAVPARAAPPKGRVQVGAPSTLGSLSAPSVTSGLQAKSSALRACYQRSLDKGARGQGKITLKFTIQADGTAGGASVKSSTLGMRAVESCLVKAIQKIPFSTASDGGSTVVSVPLVMKSS